MQTGARYWMAEKSTRRKGKAFTLRREAVAVAGRLRLPHPHRVPLRTLGGSEDAARRLRHRLAHSDRRVDSCPSLGSHARLFLFFQTRRTLVRVGVAE